MEKYDYRRAITNDIKDWIVNETDILEEGYMNGRDDDLYDWIYDEVFDEDQVTGNGTYYYGTEEECSKYLSENFDLLYPAMDTFAVDNEINILIDNYKDKSLARYFDCTIRCYLLMDCIYKAVEELKEAGLLRYKKKDDSNI